MVAISMSEKQLVYKRRITPKKAGGYLMVIPAVLVDFLGLSAGGNVNLLVDMAAPVPSLTIRRSPQEDLNP
jgi:hypothetical protein